MLRQMGLLQNSVISCYFQQKLNVEDKSNYLPEIKLVEVGILYALTN